MGETISRANVANVRTKVPSMVLMVAENGTESVPCLIIRCSVKLWISSGMPTSLGAHLNGAEVHGGGSLLRVKFSLMAMLFLHRNEVITFCVIISRIIIVKI